ncbi:MAG: outer membrane protein assembly factor BamE [Candidatus Polarisedimenticolaceae bacterium]|nr:outer membrane protein assembly factor BamE [Candidatus Polarisedimenticolaceae bacterium]
MQKTLSAFIIGTLLTLTGCSSTGEFAFVYKQDIQQGNTIDQEMVNQLKLGMSKRQVRFVLGTPLLVDLFHEERWDYIFLMKRSRETIERQAISIYFDENHLVKIAGDLKPDPTAPKVDENRELIVSVPDYIDNRGIITKLLYRLGLLDD